MQATKAVQKSALRSSQKRKRQEEEAEFGFKLTEEEPIPEDLLEYVETLAEVSPLHTSDVCAAHLHCQAAHKDCWLEDCVKSPAGISCFRGLTTWQPNPQGLVPQPQPYP